MTYRPIKLQSQLKSLFPPGDYKVIFNMYDEFEAPMLTSTLIGTITADRKEILDGR